MSERARIADKLHKKEQELQGLDEKSKAARIYIQALRDVLKLLDSDGSESAPETVLRSGSAVAQARDVILKLQKPVHINELLAALGKGATREGRASLTSSLAAYVRREEIFTRPAPNTFGLIELGHAPIEEEPIRPPAGFGQAIDDDDDIPF